MFEFFSKNAHRIRRFLFPYYCIACEKPGNYICKSCLNLIPIRKNNLCPRCEKEKTKFGELCDKCLTRKKYYLDGVLVATYYDHPIVRELIKDFKFLGFKDNARYLAKILYRKINLTPNFPLGSAVLSGVPIHLKKFRLRGFNQTELILQELQRIIAKDGQLIEIEKRLILKNVFHTAQSKTSSMAERRTNVKNTFAVNQELEMPKNIVILDDVMTTGATLNEIARTLKIGGAKKVWGLVVAREIFI